jgi:hypothetical protein
MKGDMKMKVYWEGNEDGEEIRDVELFRRLVSTPFDIVSDDSYDGIDELTGLYADVVTVDIGGERHKILSYACAPLAYGDYWTEEEG